MIFQHARFQIWNTHQHPLRHGVSEFLYSNPALPGVTNVTSALNYLVAVMYPQSKPAVATPAALPLVGNTINDMRTVTDDGDGKAASYRWEQRENEVAASWHKIYDLDWGTDSILQGYLLKTQDLYVKAQGYDDLDAAGVAVVGTLAGQSIFGGKTAGTNLTLLANSGDGVGADTGYVQFGDNVRPIADSVYSLGTTAERFLKGWFDELQVGTLNLQGGAITDTSGAISFGSASLTTTGSGTFGTLALAGGSITDTSGTIDFADENLTTLGSGTFGYVSATVSASTFATGTAIANFTFSNGNIACLSATVSFNALNLTTTGNLSGANVTGTTSGTFGSLSLSSSTITSTLVDGDIHLLATGTGRLKFDSAADSLSISATGSVDATVSSTIANLYLSSNIVGTKPTTNADLILDPDGTGAIRAGAHTMPSTDGSANLGTTAIKWGSLYLASSIGDGTTTMSVTTLMTLRDINVGVGVGMSLFWDGTKWAASAPDTEIDHGTISGLLDDDHTQYALLLGRVGGQELIGGTAANNDLTLDSTSHATKGFVRSKSSIVANTDASYSGGWQGVDVGGASNRFRHVYSAGEFFGFRLENVGALAGASANNKGRMVYLTTTDDVYVDTGGSYKRIGQNSYLEDTVWNGTDTTKTVTVSDVDATRALWQLCDNTNSYERVVCSLRATATTTVVITVGTALPAGSYRLIGIE